MNDTSAAPTGKGNAHNRFIEPPSGTARGLAAPTWKLWREWLFTHAPRTLGPITRNPNGFLFGMMARIVPRMARYLLPLAEWAEGLNQPRRFRGWSRYEPHEVLLRPSFQQTEEVTDLELEVLSGEVPRGLQGHCFFQSFAQEVKHELRFMSRPIVMRVDFEEKEGEPVKVKVTNRKIVTPAHVFKAHTEGTPDRFVFLRSLLWISATGGMQGDHGTGIVTVDDALVITANTSSPILVDKKTLKVTSMLGGKDDYYSALPIAAPFPPRYMAAHGFYDEHTNEYFSSNYGMGFTRLMVWNPDEKKMRGYLLTDEKGTPLHMRQSSHQIMCTRDYVIIFNNDGHLLDFPNPFCQDCMVMLIPRAGLTSGAKRVKCKLVELPMTASHEIADYENPDDIITFYTAGTVSFAPDMSGVLPNDVTKQSGEYYADAYWGTFPVSQSDMGHMGRYTIDAKKGQLIDFRKVSDPRLTWDAQYANTLGGMGIRANKDGPAKWDRFYATFFGFKKSSVIKRMDDIFGVHKHTQLLWDELPEQPVPGAIVAVDTKTWEIVDSFSFPPDTQPGHSCNVPDANGKVWFLTPAQSDTIDHFYLFDPLNLAQGPVCVLRSPVRLPYVQHPTWAKDTETRRARFPMNLEHDLIVKGMVGSAEKVVREKVIPYFKGSDA
jgi:carotenoid cleavage dioxygenase-like enzyme